MDSETKCRLNRWIKARVGEPVSALDLGERLLVFGTISGYVGIFDLESTELHYLNISYDELVRGVQIVDRRQVYCVIGDL
jgi:hypothetical protein